MVEQQLDPKTIMKFAFGFAPPLMIETAIRFHIFDLCDTQGFSLDRLVEKTGCSPRGLRALLNGLVGLELLMREGNDVYKTTPTASTFLVRNKPTYHGGLFEHVSKQLMPAWLELSKSVQSGLPSRDVTDGRDTFFSEFVEAIFPMSYPVAKVLGDVLGLERAENPVSVLDIAAGSGVYGIGLAERSPNVRVTAVDYPKVLEVTRKVVARFGLEDRFNYLAGNIRTVDFGSGFNLATLGQILHSEGERWSRRLVRKVYNALVPGGVIAIAEFLVDEDRRGPVSNLIFGCNMLINTEEGDVFTFSQVRSWLEDVGFRRVRTIDAPGPATLLLADRPV